MVPEIVPLFYMPTVPTNSITGMGYLIVSFSRTLISDYY